jgi:hypothetical protein
VRQKVAKQEKTDVQGEERTGRSGRGGQGRGAPRSKGAGRAGDSGGGDRGRDGARSHQELGEHGLIQLGHVNRPRVAQNKIDTRFLGGRRCCVCRVCRVCGEP